MLAGGFAICGASTNGLIGTHFVSAAHDHGMPTTAAAALLALVGIFDVAGTSSPAGSPTASTRGCCSSSTTRCAGVADAAAVAVRADRAAEMWVFIIFYGLDWVATVPPTVALCREWFGAEGPIVFGWVFAAHQVGAALAATGAGAIRDLNGSYDLAFFVAGGLCAAAALMSATIARRVRRGGGPGRAAPAQPSTVG